MGQNRTYLTLCAFGVPCTVVELSELVKKLDDWSMMCFFRWVQVWEGQLSGMGPEKTSGGRVEGT